MVTGNLQWPPNVLIEWPASTFIEWPPYSTGSSVNAGDAFFAFAVAEPTVTHTAAPLDVDAGDVLFAFAISQPSVQHGTADSVDAGDVLFAFAVSVPTVQHGTADRVNPGDANFAFAVSSPTVSHGKNAGDATFTFTSPEPGITHGNRKTANAGDAFFSFIYVGPTVHNIRVADDHFVDARSANFNFDASEPTDTLATDAVGVMWAFNVPQPTVHVVNTRNDHMVNASPANFAFAASTPTDTLSTNAGDALWAFTLPHPTVHVARVSNDHNIDAGDVAFAFGVPQPSITTGGTTSVNAGDVAFAFVASQPGVTLTELHAVNPGDAFFAFAAPEPGVTLNQAHAAAAGDALWAFAVPAAGSGVFNLPSAPTNLRLVTAGYDFLSIAWQAAPTGNLPLLRYEYRLGTGAWIDTGSTSPNFVIHLLTPNTDYSITVRAVNALGNGPASEALNARTLTAMPPSVPLHVRAMTTGTTAIDLAWNTPAMINGASILFYEVCVFDPDGSPTPFERFEATNTTWRVRGLAFYHRYCFRVRAVNSAGAGPQSPPVCAVPTPSATVTTPPGQRIPLLDLDRQSLIVRLDGQDCRLSVWYQVDDKGWYATLEVPVNAPVVRSRRITTNSGLLDRLPDVIGGNVVCRAVDSDSEGLDPARDAWRRGTHSLVWEPA